MEEGCCSEVLLQPLLKPWDPGALPGPLTAGGRDHIHLLLCFSPGEKTSRLLVKTRGPAAPSVGMDREPAPPSWATRLVLWPPGSGAGSPARDPGLTRAPRAGTNLLWGLRARQGLWFLSLVQVLGEIFQARDLQVTLIFRKLQGGEGEKKMHLTREDGRAGQTRGQNADLEESRRGMLLLLPSHFPENLLQRPGVTAMQTPLKCHWPHQGKLLGEACSRPGCSCCNLNFVQNF